MRAFWGRYELCSHERDDPECDGKGVHWALLEVDVENIPGQPDAVRIVKPNIGVVDAIDVRPTVEEAKRRLSDNLRFLASDIEKQMREAEYGARRVLEGGIEPVRLEPKSEVSTSSRLG
jgi:hypothetical protein